MKELKTSLIELEVTMPPKGSYTFVVALVNRQGLRTHVVEVVIAEEEWGETDPLRFQKQIIDPAMAALRGHVKDRETWIMPEPRQKL